MKTKKTTALDLWSVAETFLPEDLDALAVECGAIRRPRKVVRAVQMLRALLIYAGTGSFRTASALAQSSALIDITAEGLFYRLSHSEVFLERVLAHLVGSFASVPVGFRCRIVDATVVSGPASKGTDWRVHVGYEPCHGVPCSVTITDASVGEHLGLHGLKAGELVLADRGYGSAGNVHTALLAGADVLIRVSRGQIRLIDAQGSRLDWRTLDGQVPEVGAVSFEFTMPVPPASRKPNTPWNEKDASVWHPVRLVAARSRKGEVVWLITNLPADRLGAEQACDLYRARWQVELYFKRLKSLGDLDVQRSRAGPTARAGLLAKMILLMLTSLLRDRERGFSPYGYPVRQARTQPVAGICLHTQAVNRRALAKREAASVSAG